MRHAVSSQTSFDDAEYRKAKGLELSFAWPLWAEFFKQGEPKHPIPERQCSALQHRLNLAFVLHVFVNRIL